VAARMAHNHEVPGSSPGPATKKSAPIQRGIFLGSQPILGSGTQILP
jgi:hypothetical protein